jgi:hypothetical protein
MLTFEDLTGYFLKAAGRLNLVTHAEYWVNARSLEREFACTCHTGSCEEAEVHSACTLSFTWSTLDTALSLEGPIGVCDFFHEPEELCPHLHTKDIPPLVLDLAYSAPLTMNGASVYDSALLSLTQTLKLRASEQSGSAIETRPGVTFTPQESCLQPEALTLQQRVELPIWHPEECMDCTMNTIFALDALSSVTIALSMKRTGLMRLLPITHDLKSGYQK